jgi:hypothetical protein
MRDSAMQDSAIQNQQDDQVTVGVDRETLAELKWLADYMGVLPSKALRQAIATQAYIEKLQRKEKGELLVRKGGELYKLTFQPVGEDKPLSRRA